MVIYDLICEFGHEFEGWFKSRDELSSQQASGLLTCPYCDSDEVSKKLTAPKLGKKSTATDTQDSVQDLQFPTAQNVAIDSGASPEAYKKVQKMLGEVHNFIDANFEDVGNRFAEQALSIHRGEKEASNIRGTANQDQLADLAKEGVTALPMPPKPIDKKKLN